MGKKNIGQKRDSWFENYHDIPELGIIGTRKIDDRITHYDTNDFKDATVIDLGCNMGQMSFQAEKWGARKVIGVEFDADAVENAKAIKEKLNSNVMFVVDDLDSNFFWNSLPVIDVVMFLAVIDTHELENRYGILSKACAKTNKVLYFEGHGKQSSGRYLKNIIEYTDFSQIVYKGNTPVNRPFFRCTRDILNEEQFMQKIINSTHNKIAVVGKSLAGKSTFRLKYWQVLTDLGYSVIDDLRHIKTVKENDEGILIPTSIDKILPEQVKDFDKFILFDYRATEYYDQFDAVFFLTPDIDNIGQNRERKNPMRSPSLKNFDTVKEVYTVNIL
jgi:predicted nicotinamide N-methyase